MPNGVTDVTTLLELERLRAAMHGVENAVLQSYWCTQGTAFDDILEQLRACADNLTKGRCAPNEVQVGGVCVPKKGLGA